MCLFAQTRSQSFPTSDTITLYEAKATYYADKFVGRKTANGEIFSQDKYTAAHHSIKMGTLVLVSNPINGRQVIVRINDRCPRRGIIDLTRKAIDKIGIKGTGSVTIRILPPSYRYAWEHQDESVTPEEIRQVPESTIAIENSNPNPKDEKKPPTETITTTIPANPHSKKSIQPIEQPKEDSKKASPPAAQATQQKADPNAKYDILLATGVPRSMSEQYINKLPLHLKENAQMKPERTSGKLTLTLSLSTTHKKASAIQKKLKKTFPDCHVIKSD